MIDGASDDGSWESWDGEAVGIEECLFCSHLSKTMEKSIKHMTTAHSFFIPDLKYVCNLEGLIGYLGESCMRRDKTGNTKRSIPGDGSAVPINV